MRSRLWVLAAVPLLFLLMGARTVPLVDPEPLAVPAGLSVEQVRRAIKAAFAERGWLVNRDEGGVVEATLNLRQHSVKVAADYDASTVRLRYVDSTNLLYGDKGGGRVIHRNYNNWMKNVFASLQRNLYLGQS